MPAQLRPLALCLLLLPSLARASVDSEVADPLGTRGTVMLNVRYDLWTVDVPVPGVPRLMSGAAPSLGLSTDLYGRHLGFSLGFRALSTREIRAGDTALANSELSLIEVHPDFNVVLLNANGVFLSAGAGMDVRMNVLNFNEEFSRSVSTWLALVPGANVRARFFLGPNLYATATAFAGPLTLTGVWVSAGQSTNLSGPPTIPPTSPAQAYFAKGDLQNHFVLGGMVGFTYRPLEWLGATVGVAYRRAAFQVKDRGDALETDVQPFAGLDLLY